MMSDPNLSIPAISFEFFPPKTAQGQEKLAQEQTLILAATRPDFFSVTYGAGGSTREPTRDTVYTTMERTHISTAPHIACIGDRKSNIQQLLQEYQEQGIQRLVALRGDPPSAANVDKSELPYAVDLVAFIRETTGQHFTIEVAAYPEVHPEATSIETDLHHLKAKLDAGADSAITQYFFNIDAFTDFMNRAHKIGINAPIVPGIMPITNYEKLARFSEMCGAEIPRWLKYRLQALQDDQLSLAAFGNDFVSSLCEQLISIGAPGLHFYTLNQAQPSLAICRSLNLIT